LPYMDATMSMRRDDTDTILYRSTRTHRGEPLANLDASYQAVGEPFFAKPGTLEYWLTARYCLYSADRKNRLYRGEIDHPPWSLSSATWQARENSMGNPLGFDLRSHPHLLSAQPITVRAWPATRC
jgi:uncharacterized protein YqjF (DUF2071 family)